MSICIKNGLIHDAIHEMAYQADILIENGKITAIGENLTGDLYGSRLPGDHKVGAATHGGRPDREEVTTFMAAGPDVKPGVIVERRSMVDEAPTMARMLGFVMEDTDGTAIEEILR